MTPGTRVRARTAVPTATMLGTAVASIAVVLALGGCSANPDGAMRSGDVDGGALTVSAAASLADVVGSLVAAYERTQPGVTITTNFGSSAQLVQQALAGARVDVLIPADESAAEPLIDAGLVTDDVRRMASNALVLVVPRADPGGISGIADLASPGVRVAVCDEQVPCGRSTAEVLDTAGVRLAAPSEENDVRAVLSKVVTGEVDAGFVYRTDALVAGDAVLVRPIESDVVNRYPVLVLRDSRDVDEAGAFRDWLLSPDAQAILGDAGFDPAD
ncbi:molybdate ABC transporter substrate-binding protein [Planctomonas psychrotolerans]|uniref:molybdate ABC transporter substrate-binding protein n=1 Tax=Planctomonas psychrotolerans TaxID=2528712 RepID=UPI001D0D4E5B|nr:molybdate ABC transporter substrate-binding protein [Planctomonas psychrotolerans]